MQITRNLELYTKRFQYHPPWTLTFWGFGFNFHNNGQDEWGHPNTYLIIPLIGKFVWFKGPIDRSNWYFSGISNDTVCYISPDYKKEALLPPPEPDFVFTPDYDLYDWIMDNQPTLSHRDIITRALEIENIP